MKENFQKELELKIFRYPYSDNLIKANLLNKSSKEKDFLLFKKELPKIFIGKSKDAMEELEMEEFKRSSFQVKPEEILIFEQGDDVYQRDEKRKIKEYSQDNSKEEFKTVTIFPQKEYTLFDIFLKDSENKFKISLPPYHSPKEFFKGKYYLKIEYLAKEVIFSWLDSEEKCFRLEVKPQKIFSEIFLLEVK